MKSTGRKISARRLLDKFTMKAPIGDLTAIPIIARLSPEGLGQPTV